MGNRHSNLEVLITLLMLASTARAEDSIHVEMLDLAKNRSAFVGESVTTHGCLVHSPHGSFIQPCVKDASWRESVLINDFEGKGIRAFKQLGIAFNSYVEGDFSGHVVELDVDRPKPGKRFFLKLESVTNVAAYKP